MYVVTLGVDDRPAAEDIGVTEGVDDVGVDGGRLAACRR